MSFKIIVDSTLEWMWNNSGFVLLVIVLLYMIHKPLAKFIASIINLFRKKKEPAANTNAFSFNVDELFGTPSKDTMSALKEQRLLAEQNLDMIKDDGNRLVQEEKDCIDNFNQTRSKINADKMQLSMRYNVWITQLKAIDNMIAQNKQMEEDLKRFKKNK